MQTPDLGRVTIDFGGTCISLHGKRSTSQPGTHQIHESQSIQFVSFRLMYSLPQLMD